MVRRCLLSTLRCWRRGDSKPSLLQKLEMVKFKEKRMAWPGCTFHGDPPSHCLRSSWHSPRSLAVAFTLPKLMNGNKIDFSNRLSKHSQTPTQLIIEFYRFSYHQFCFIEGLAHHQSFFWKILHEIRRSVNGATGIAYIQN